MTLTPNSYIHTLIYFSREGIKDRVFESNIEKQYYNEGVFVEDSVLNTYVNYQSLLFKVSYRGAITYSNKINTQNKIEVGSQYTLSNYDYRQNKLKKDARTRVSLVDFHKSLGTINNYISWQNRFNEEITLVTGIHNMNVFLNNKSTVEPRIFLSWQLDPSSSFQAGHGRHSTMESPHNYFAKIKSKDGEITEPNKNLDLLKAHHFVVGFEK